MRVDKYEVKQRETQSINVDKQNKLVFGFETWLKVQVCPQVDDE